MSGDSPNDKNSSKEIKIIIYLQKKKEKKDN